jgi:hypothetical protein
LDKEAEYGDVCLVISNWLRDHGDPINARNAVRGRVKRCISLLSDDDPSNDVAALVSLFKTFVAVRGSDADLGATLHLIKLHDERRLKAHDIRRNIHISQRIDSEADLSESLDQVQLADTGAEDDGYRDDVEIWFTTTDPTTECSSCKKELVTFHWWYFCRSCPTKTLCRRCYLQLRPAVAANPDDAASSTLHKIPASVCELEHELYYAGPYIRPDEHVPKGMVPLVSATRERQEIWIEEWKDRLAKEWDTDDFEFEGGLSAWCSRVLPESQRSRWATFFK